MRPVFRSAALGLGLAVVAATVVGCAPDDPWSGSTAASGDLTTKTRNPAVAIHAEPREDSEVIDTRMLVCSDIDHSKVDTRVPVEGKGMWYQVVGGGWAFDGDWCI